jgi:hypothetical protein
VNGHGIAQHTILQHCYFIHYHKKIMVQGLSYYAEALVTVLGHLVNLPFDKQRFVKRF